MMMMSLFKIILVVAFGNFCVTDSAWYNPVDLLCQAMSVTAGECCRYPFIRTGETVHGLRQGMNRKFFGQHIAASAVLNAIEDHIDNENPGKPLVLSFHGQPGCGKSFLSKLIAETIFQYGEQSGYYTFYSAAKDFGNPLEIQRYKVGTQPNKPVLARARYRKMSNKLCVNIHPDLERACLEQDQLIREVPYKLKQCDRALFVFDEVEDMPPSVLDALVPYLDRKGTLDGIPISRAIYIFLSNTGESNITRITLEASNREGLTRRDFENVLSAVALRESNKGFSQSKLIQRHLVDFYIPFLPMERRHVMQCARAEIERRGLVMKPELVADRLVYGPPTNKKFSVAGCKKVASEVGEVHTDHKHPEF